MIWSAEPTCFKAPILPFCHIFITKFDFKRADCIIENNFEYLYELRTQLCSFLWRPPRMQEVAGQNPTWRRKISAFSLHIGTEKYFQYNIMSARLKWSFVMVYSTVDKQLTRSLSFFSRENSMRLLVCDSAFDPLRQYLEEIEYISRAKF